MRIRHLFYLLLALPLAFAACEESGDEVLPPVLKLTSEDTLSFNAEGGEGTITYTLENGMDNIKIQVQCDADWVQNIAAAKDKVTFNVAANEGAKRTTKIVVSYSELSFNVAIEQAKGADKPSDNDDNGDNNNGDNGNDDGNNDGNTEEDDNKDEGNNEGNEDGNEDGNVDDDEEPYLYEAVLDGAKRLDSTALELPYNNFAIDFFTNDNTTRFTVYLVGNASDTILQPGTYNVDNKGIFFLKDQELCANLQKYTLEKGEVVVSGNYNSGYEFVITLADVDGNLFNFIYKGNVQDMVPSTDEPTDSVTFTANYLDLYYDSMGDVSLYYAILSDIGLDEIGYELPGGTYYVVDFYGPDVEIDEEGYVTIPAGTYTFDIYNTASEWTFSDYYSAYYKMSNDGYGYDAEEYFEAGKAVVTANGITLTVTINGVEHVVTYDDVPTAYVGFPAEAPTEGEVFVTELIGGYFGQDYGVGYSYYIVLSNKEIDMDGYLSPDAYGYTLDLYSVAPTIDSNGYATIPAGTYYFDPFDTAEEWTIGGSFSYYEVSDANGSSDIFGFDDITVVVTADGITANIVIEGKEHTMIYNGAPKIYVGVDVYAYQTRAKSVDAKHKPAKHAVKPFLHK